jgi:TP901 family phage tail tape measure protein
MGMSGAVNLGSAYGDFLVDTSGVEASLNKAFQTVERTAESAFARVGSHIQKAGDKLSSWGLSLTKLTAPITLMGAAGIKAFASFDEALTEIKARTGATADEMEKVKKVALEMGKSTKYSATEASEGMLQLLASGYDLTQTFEALPAVLNAAAAGNMDLGFTADAVTDVLAMFNLEAKDAAMVADVLAKASAASSAEINDLAQGFGNVGPIAAQFGLSVEETAAILAIFAENGVKGAEAGTQLKSMLTHLSSPTKEVQKTWAKLGLSLFDAYGAVKPIPQVLGELSAKLATMTDKERIQTTQALAGSFGQIGATILTSNMSIEEMVALMDQQAGAAEVARARMSSLNGMVKQFKNSIETMLITALGPLIDDYLKPGLKRVTQFVNQLTEWSNKNPKLTKRIVSMLAALSAVGPTLFAIGKALGIIGALVATLANPIAWLVLAVTGLAAAWESNFGGLRDALTPVRNALADVFYWLQQAYTFGASSGGVFGGITAALRALFYVYADGKTTFFSNILQALGVTEGAAQRVGLAIVGFKDRIVAAFGQVVGFVRTSVIPTFGLLVTWLTTAFVPAVSKVILGSVLPLVRSFVYFLADAWRIVSPALANLYNWFVGSALPGILTFITNTALPALGKLIDFVSAIFTATSPYLLAFLDWFLNTGMPAVVTFINDTVIPAIQGFIDVVAGLDATDITAIGLALAAWIAPSVITGIAGLVASIGKLVLGLASTSLPMLVMLGLVAALATNFGGLKDAVIQVGEGIREKDTQKTLDGIVDALFAIPMGIAEWIGEQAGINVPEGLKSWKTIISQVGIIVGALPGWVKNKLIELGKTIEEKVQSISDAAMGIGTAIVDGLKKGIEDAWSGFTDFLEDKISGGVVGDVARYLGIKSPSSVFLEFGKNIIAGLKGGLAQTTILVLQLAYLKALVTHAGESIIAAAGLAGTKIIPAVIGGLTQFGQFATALHQLVTIVYGYSESFNLSGKTLGELMVLGMIAGIYAQWGNLMSAAQQLADAVRNTLRNAFQIRSPSKVFQKMGENMTAGLALGLQNTAPVNESLRLLVNTATPAPGAPNNTNTVNNAQRYTINVYVDAATAGPNLGQDIAAQIKAALTAQGGGVSVG